MKLDVLRHHDTSKTASSGDGQHLSVICRWGANSSHNLPCSNDEAAIWTKGNQRASVFLGPALIGLSHPLSISSNLHHHHQLGCSISRSRSRWSAPIYLSARRAAYSLFLLPSSCLLQRQTQSLVETRLPREPSILSKTRYKPQPPF
jgi:hypothetical protein